MGMENIRSQKQAISGWLPYGPTCDNSHSPTKTFREIIRLTHNSLRIGHYKNGLFLIEVTCTLLKERLKSGQNCTENEPLRTPERLISRTQLKNGC